MLLRGRGCQTQMPEISSAPVAVRFSCAPCEAAAVASVGQNSCRKFGEAEAARSTPQTTEAAQSGVRGLQLRTVRGVLCQFVQSSESFVVRLQPSADVMLMMMMVSTAASVRMPSATSNAAPASTPRSLALARILTVFVVVKIILSRHRGPAAGRLLLGLLLRSWASLSDTADWKRSTGSSAWRAESCSCGFCLLRFPTTANTKSKDNRKRRTRRGMGINPSANQSTRSKGNQTNHGPGSAATEALTGRTLPGAILCCRQLHVRIELHQAA